MKIKERFDNSDHKKARKLVLRAQREAGPKNFNAANARVDWSEHGKVRDMLVLNRVERISGKPMIETKQGDRFFSAKPGELDEECVLPLISLPHGLIDTEEQTIFEVMILASLSKAG